MKTKTLLTTDVHLTDGFKASGTSPPDSAEGKACSTCGQAKPLNEFYSKGTRTDSACKACQKKKKQAKYVATRNEDAIAGLKAVIGITTQGLGKRLRFEIEKLERIIVCLQKSKR